MFQVGSSTWLVPRWKHWVTRWHSSIRFWRSRCIQILHSLKRNHVIGMRSPARMLDMSCNAKMPDTSWYRIRIHLGKLHLSPLHGIFYISPSLPPSLRPSLPLYVLCLCGMHAFPSGTYPSTHLPCPWESHQLRVCSLLPSRWSAPADFSLALPTWNPTPEFLAAWHLQNKTTTPRCKIVHEFMISEFF